MLYSFFTILLIINSVFGKKDYGLSGKMVSTPIGFRPVECVLHADEDVILRSIDGIGTYAHYPNSGRRSFHPEIRGCVENARDLAEERRQRIANNKNKNNKTSNIVGSVSNVENLKTWEVYASETVQTMGTFTSQYQLPTDNPTTGVDIILYYFIGMQNNDDAVVTIIQPVIEYCDTCGTGSKPGWNMSPWNCCASGQTWQGPIKVIPTTGSYINGVVMSNTTYDYISCENPSTGDKTTLTVSDARRTFDWIAFTLEQYNVDNCDDYPSTPFWSRQMKLATAAGTSFTPSWSYTNGDGCGGNIKAQDPADLALYSRSS
jgi:hypothetical protein